MVSSDIDYINPIQNAGKSVECERNIFNTTISAAELHAGRAGPPRGPKKNLRAARAAHDPTTMTTNLSCFSLSRVREYLIKWKFVITHLHSLQKLSSMKGFLNLTLQVTIKNRNFWAENI